MLVLLPPSEGKAAAPARGRALDLASLSYPELSTARSTVLDVLVTLCRTDPARAAQVLELGPRLAGEVDIDAAVPDSPTRPARDLYTGVLYTALALGDLPPAAARRASARLAIASGLWGLVRPSDRLPRYRLPGGLNLPGLGPLAAFWREPLARVLPAAAGRGVVLDLRSTTYAAAWTPSGTLAPRTVTVRVLHERDGVRRVMSEANKAVKGRLTRALLLDGSAPTSAGDLVDLMRSLGAAGGNAGWSTEDSTDAGDRRRGGPLRVDLVTTDLHMRPRLDTAVRRGLQAANRS